MEQPGAVRLRNVGAEVISGADGAELAANLNTFFEAGDEKVFVAIYHVASFEVLILYAE